MFLFSLITYLYVAWILWQREYARSLFSVFNFEYVEYFLFLNPQDEVGPSISSSVVLCSFILLVYIVVLVLVFCLCPSSVRVVATFSGNTPNPSWTWWWWWSVEYFESRVSVPFFLLLQLYGCMEPKHVAVINDLSFNCNYLIKNCVRLWNYIYIFC
jgi:hypothetical protein